MIAARAESIKNAEENRNLAVGLGGTCVVILTFVLLFLYAGAESTQFNFLLFEVTLTVILTAMFAFTFAGTLYFTVMGLAASKSPRAALVDARAYLSFVVGIVLLTAEPALICFTANLTVVGSIALALWVGFLALLGYSVIEWNRLG